MSYSPNKLSISEFKFGIELELNEDSDDCECLIRLLDGWIMFEEHCGTEIISPPLVGYKGLMAVRKQIQIIHKEYTTVGVEDAGLHIHVDIQHFLLGQAKKLLHIANNFNDVMFAIADGSRYNNQYCRQILLCEKDINDCCSIADLQRLQEDERYSSLNFYAFPKHGTVEFRYFASTFQWRRLYSLISLCLRMVAFAESDNPIPSRKPEGWVSPGHSYAKKQLKTLDCGKEIFFDALQIDGGVRNVLEESFEKNKNKKMTSSTVESFEQYPKGLRSRL